MSDRRKIEIPVLPYLILVISLGVLVAGGLIFLNYPAHKTVAWGTLATGAAMAILSFVLRPAMASEIFASRKTVLWINDIVLIFVIIGIGMVLSHIGFRRNVRYDFTYNKMFSLSDMTLKTIRGLEKDVKITAFYPRGAVEENMLKELLDEYRRQNMRLSYAIVDPMRDPVTARSMNVNSMGTVVVQSGADRFDLYSKDLFELPPPYSPPDVKPKFLGEQALTTAILNVTSGVKRLILFVQGHGEPSLGGYQQRDIAGVNELLNRENFDVADLTLLDNDIDSRASALIIVSPQQDYIESELEKIRSFVKSRNGHLLVALDPGRKLPVLEAFLLREFGINMNGDIVVDPRGIQRNFWSVAPELGDHPIVAPIREKNMLVLMFHCQSITWEPKDDYKSEVFLRSIENSWAKRGLDENDQIQVGFEEGQDARGPLNLGLALERTGVASGSRILVLGDSDFFANGLIGSLANRDLFVNGINWLVGQHQMLSIRPRVLEVPQIVLDEKDAGKIFSFCVFGAPAMVVLMGFCVYLYRRRV